MSETVNQNYQAVYSELFGQTPPTSVQMGESNTDILRAGRGFIDGFDFTMQTQVGCPGGCLFCYVPSGRMLTPASLRGSRGERWGFEVRQKRQVVSKFAAHLHSGILTDKTIYWSGVTDPYASKPAETRELWKLLNDAPPELRPRRIAVQTRYRPDRDAELIAQYTHSTQPADEGPAVVVSYSIGTDRNDLIQAWERATPRFEQRMDAIRTLRQNNIFVVATLSPFGFWNDLSGTLEQFLEWGVAYLTCLFFKKATDSANTPQPFLAYLQNHHPTLLNPQWQAEQVQTLKSIYGENHVLLYKAGFASLTAPHRVALASSFAQGA